MSNALRTLASISAFFSKTFALWVIAFALISYYFPQGFLFLLPYVSNPLRCCYVWYGLDLHHQKTSQKCFHRPIQVIIGIVGQFVLMPLIAFFLVKAFGLSANLAAGVLLVGCCPGGTFIQNVMSYLGKGDVPLSVTITSCTTILAPLVTPGLFWLFAHQYIEVDPVAMFWSIVKIVLLPIIGGVVVNALFGTVVKKVVVALPLISVFAIISIVTAVVSASAEGIAETALIIFLVVALHNCIGYLLATYWVRYLA